MFTLPSGHGDEAASANSVVENDVEDEISCDEVDQVRWLLKSRVFRSRSCRLVFLGRRASYRDGYNDCHSGTCV